MNSKVKVKLHAHRVLTVKIFREYSAVYGSDLHDSSRCQIYFDEA
jgi:hypothetical protein